MDFRNKLLFFLKSYLAYQVPHQIHLKYLKLYLKTLSRKQLDEISSRASYYYKNQTTFEMEEIEKKRFDIFGKGHSAYRCDLANILKYYPKTLNVNYQFGDSTQFHSTPTLVKARAISTMSDQSIIMRFDSYRHFGWRRDPIKTIDKLDKAVWRGGLNDNFQRMSLIKLWKNHKLFDIAAVSGDLSKRRKQVDYLSIPEQLQYKFVLSIEGNDVATNLKWIMASNSVCVMPPPTKESWFMEGLLKPWVHYVPILPDLSDLAEVIEQCIAEPQKILNIIKNANRWCQEFMDTRFENAVGYEVLRRYFEQSGQSTNQSKWV